MIKIVNGKIVREGIVASAGSPVVQRRRCSIADLQLKEFAQETVAPTFEEEPAAPITWSDILALQIKVFGVSLTAKNLAILSLVSFLWTGLTGLLVTLLALYIGTVFSSNIQPTSPVVEEAPKGSPSLNLSGSLGSSSPSLRSSTGSMTTGSPSLRVSGGSSPLLSRSIGSPSLSRPLHPRLVTLKSLELDSTPLTGTSA